jgi:glycosyltransferase involved in cell wall biosynthesis
MNNFLAVIMSIYKNDRYEFLKTAIESIQNQSYRSFDFYVICDGSINKECEKYLDSLNDKRIIIKKRQLNKGLAYSLNELLHIVLDKDYEYIARMDADDISLKKRFELQIKFLKANQAIDCLGTSAIEINEDEEVFFEKKMPATDFECKKMFIKRDCLIHPTVMFRRSYFEKAGLYPLDTYFGEDTMMWAKGFLNQCKFSNLNDNLLYFRLDENFFQRRRGLKHAMSILTLRRKVNKMLGFGFKANVFAYLYFLAKLMPKPVLYLIYKIAR